jgi:hypothetical protein
MSWWLSGALLCLIFLLSHKNFSCIFASSPFVCFLREKRQKGDFSKNIISCEVLFQVKVRFGAKL